jgi:hypothetical protein
MASWILNTLGYHIKDSTLMSPVIQDDKEKKIEFGLEQIKLVKQRLGKEGKKRMCA